MNEERLLTVIQAPIVTEKTAASEDSNLVAFRVAPNATKREVKQAVEKLFSVVVKSVNTCNVKGKAKRFGRFNGKRKDWKKAYVTLQEGSEIEFFVE